MTPTDTPRRVLIVEDSPEDATILTRLLTQIPGHAYDVEHTPTGEGALATIAREGFDCTCVLLDYRLPDMDGLAVLAALRALTHAEHLPVVMLTGTGDERLVVQVLQAGAQDYLTKSQLTTEALRRAIDNAVDRCELAQRLATERRRLAFLTEAGLALSTSLDPAQILTRVARLAVSFVGDWCVIDAFEGERLLRQVAVAHSDPAKELLARELQRRFPPPLQGTPDQDGFTAPRPTALLPEVTAAVLDALPLEQDQRQLVRALGLRSYIVVPLLLRGRGLGQLAVAITESARRYDEDDLRLVEELARRAALAIDNGRLYQRERAAVRDRERFIAIAAHEIKNPLTSVRGYAQLLERRMRLEYPDDRRGLTASTRIIAETDRLQGLVDDLLNVSSLQQGQLTLHRRPLDLAALARTIVARFIDNGTPEPEQQLILDAPEAVMIQGDAARLDQVLSNLITNGLKYSPEGGDVRVRVRRAGAHARITIQDRGIGIPAEVQAQIFEPFARTEAARATTAGVGLGLYIVARIVAGHGGTIAVDSAPGAGSTFTVHLPLHVTEEPSGLHSPLHPASAF